MLILLTLLSWITPSKEAQENYIMMSMIIDGYTEYEIDIIMSEMRKT